MMMMLILIMKLMLGLWWSLDGGHDGEDDDGDGDNDDGDGDNDDDSARVA